MPGIWEYIRGLFEEAAESSASKPLLHAMIERSEGYNNGYQKWQDSLIKRRLLEWLSKQYAIYRVLPKDIDDAMDFLDTRSSNGFVIHFYKTNYNRQEVVYFFDYLKDKMRTLDYKLQISDTRTYNQDKWVETVERHYLKPRLAVEIEGKNNQGFGNVTISLVFRNDEVYQLKLQATTYSDHQYQEAAAFSELMAAILQ